MKLLKGALAAILAVSMTACSTQSSKQEEKESKKRGAYQNSGAYGSTVSVRAWALR